MRKTSKRMRCALVGDEVKYSMKSCTKTKATNPSSNVPVYCKPCLVNNIKTVHWKDNMMCHIKSSHAHMFDSNDPPAYFVRIRIVSIM